MSKQKSAKKTKRSYDADATRKRLLDAAEEEFAQKGIHGARVDYIAQKANANKAMIYLYFNSKEGLYKQVFLNSYRKITEQEELLDLNEKDIPCLTEKLFETYFDFHERNPNFWKFLAWANLTPSAQINAEELKGMSSKVMGHIKSLYTKGQQEGIFDPEIKYESYIFSIMSVCFFYRSNLITMKGTLNLDISEPRNRKKLIKEILKLMEHGLIIKK